MLKMDCQSMPLVRVLRNTADPQDNGCPVIVVLPSDSKCRCISAVRSPGAVLCLIDDDVDDSGHDANCDSHGGDGRLNLGVTAW